MVLAIESTDDIRYYPPNCNPALHNFALRTKELGVARVRNAQAKGKSGWSFFCLRCVRWVHSWV